MAASVNDKLTDTRNSARPVTTTVTSTRSAGGTTLSCQSLTGWPTASKVHFVTYQLNSSGEVVANSQLDCYGIVSGSDITNFTVVDGTDGGNSVGDYVEMLPTAAWGQGLSDWGNTEHNRDGTHSAITATTSTTTSATVTDTISERTSGNGVAVDGLNIKDSKLNTNDSVVTANITDDAVTAAKIATSAVGSPEWKPTTATVSGGASATTSETTVATTTIAPTVASNLFIVADGIVEFGTSPPTWTITLRLKVDGSTVRSYTVRKDADSGSNQTSAFCLQALSSVSSGSRTVSVTAQSDNVTTTVYASATIIAMSNV